MVRIIHTREPAYVSFWNKRAGQRERGPQPHHLYRGSRKQSLGKAKCPGLSPMWPRLPVLIPGVVPELRRCHRMKVTPEHQMYKKI